MRASRLSFAAATAIVATCLAATQTLAQAPNPPRAVAALAAARMIESQVSRGQVTKSARLEIARLHIESASARAADDPVAVENLRTAGLYLSGVDPERSANVLVQAAERAISIGDIVSAANSYLDAAAALSENGSATVTPVEVQQLFDWVSKAALLANSPLLSTGDRQQILRRVGTEGYFAG